MKECNISVNKPRYEVLHALRGTAALIVLIYHLFEGFASSPKTQFFNHGYLAVPFFFMLSGFVIGYAYDDRWANMTTRQFIVRRFVRLHPMVLMGALLGLVSYILQGSVDWNGNFVPIGWVLLSFVCTVCMIPAIPNTNLDIRGFGELYPMNGPYWSLFVEYLGNLIYVLILRRLNNKTLTAVVVISGLYVLYYCISNGSGNGNLGIGWTMNDNYLIDGILCMIFFFSCGLVISRVSDKFRFNTKYMFAISSVLLFVLLAMPYMDMTEGMEWKNGLYEALVVLIVFPCIIIFASRNSLESSFGRKICEIAGDISYPVYAIHYPSMYLFYSWVWKNNYTFSQVWYVGVFVIILNIVLAYVLMHLYDNPIRKYIGSKIFG